MAYIVRIKNDNPTYIVGLSKLEIEVIIRELKRVSSLFTDIHEIKDINQIKKYALIRDLEYILV